MHTYEMDSGVWSKLPLPEGNGQCCEAIEFFPERDVLVWSRGSDEVVLFSNNQWQVLASASGLSSTWMFAEYNPVHKIVLLGSSTGKLYKLGVKGGLVALGNMPVPVYDGSAWNGVVTFDPTSGDYLVFTSPTRELHIFDPISDKWQKSVKQPPQGFASSGLMAAPVPSYGVVLFATCRTSAGSCKTWLYKHSTTASPLPPTPQ